jgi:hypothetical protein
MPKLDYLTDLIRNSLALSYELQDTELMELLEDAFQEVEKLKEESHDA